ncbi:MAG: hypothetical protein M3179_11400 [Actinomycetota bacterium]|nr:hypothetical protein [Actinomycetota bacterium]
MTHVVAALSWNPQVKGALYVLISVVVLCGSAYLLLSTNVGARLGFQLAGAGLFGWMMVLGLTWWVYGQGPLGPAPHWEPVETVVGDPAQTGREEALEEFPEGWDRIELTDPAVADAQPIADGRLTGDNGRFESASDYVVVGAAKKGGDDKGPFGILNFRPFDIFHTPHYMMITVQPALEQPTPEGGAPPRPVPDPNQETVSVVLLRDLGALRLNPAIVAIASGVLFGLFVYVLHQRDKDAMEARANA